MGSLIPGTNSNRLGNPCEEKRATDVQAVCSARKAK